jgi:hypothetical protein
MPGEAGQKHPAPSHRLGSEVWPTEPTLPT